MRNFTKRYLVYLSGPRAMKDLYQCLNTFNSRKLGRNRRGMVMMTNYSGRKLPNGQWEIIISFVTGRSHFLYYRISRTKLEHKSKFRVYRLTDFRKPLRRLAVAARLARTSVR